MSRRCRRAPRSRRTRSCSRVGVRSARSPRTARSGPQRDRASQPPGASARRGGETRRRPRRRWPRPPRRRSPRGHRSSRASVAGRAGRCAPNATARTLRPRCTTIRPLPSAATPASTARSAALERMSACDAPKAAPGEADRRRTPCSVPESARALGLTTYARPSLATARAPETSRGAMTCAAPAGAAATSTSPMAQPHARVGFTHGEHMERCAGCAASSSVSRLAAVRGQGSEGEGSQRRSGRGPSSSIACALVHKPCVFRDTFCPARGEDRRSTARPGGGRCVRRANCGEPPRRRTTARAANDPGGVAAEMHLMHAFARPPPAAGANGVAKGARSAENLRRARGQRHAPRPPPLSSPSMSSSPRSAASAHGDQHTALQSIIDCARHAA